MIDLHCHILPGLDDGAATLDDALDMARRSEEEGIETIVATPHIFRDHAEWKDFSIIDKKRCDLEEAIQANQIRVRILPGAEVHIFHGLIEAVKKHRSSLMVNGGSYMFVEFPSNHVFSGSKTLFFRLMSEGVTPIIAHPERNSVFMQNPILLFELVQLGALVQVNSGSFLGLYGDRARETVIMLLELNLVHFIGSDGHSAHSLSARMKEAVEKAGSIIGAKRALVLVNDNPQAVIVDRHIEFLEAPIHPQKRERPLNVRIPSIFRRRR